MDNIRPIKISVDDLTDIIKFVPQYERINSNQVSLTIINPSELWVPVRYIKSYKIACSNILLNNYLTNKIYPYQSCIIEDQGHHNLIIPPIIEVHRGRNVVIDGTHRLYAAYARKHKSVKVIVIDNESPLPGKYVAIQSLITLNLKLPRQISFLNYREEFFRDMKHLETGLRKFILKKHKASWSTRD